VQPLLLKASLYSKNSKFVCESSISPLWFYSHFNVDVFTNELLSKSTRTLEFLKVTPLNNGFYSCLGKKYNEDVYFLSAAELRVYGKKANLH